MNMEGTTSASSLIRSDWKNRMEHKSIRQSIAQSIKSGIPSTTMIAWQNVLDDKEIKELVDFIITSQHKTTARVNESYPEKIETQDYSLKIEKIVSENLRTPWAIEFVNSDTALISEKHGSLKWLINNELDTQLIRGLPKPHLESSTGGFMDIALDPFYEKNRWIYLAFSHTNGDITDKEALALTKIVRGKIKDNHWVDEETLFEVSDSLMVINGNRWGCRFLFDDEGHLYFTIGDMAKAMDSQDLGKATGKIFRIHRDGSIPKDNPFVNRKGALPAIFTIGNRNVQGIAMHPVTRTIWMTDHGPKGGDELNILKKGANYGWPIITYGIDYTGEIISDKTHEKGMEQPILLWSPSIAVCPSEFCTSRLFSKWENNLLVGSLAFQDLRRLVIEEERVIHQEIILKGIGRVRDLKFASQTSGIDGALYVLTNDPDEILRITAE